MKKAHKQVSPDVQITVDGSSVRRKSSFLKSKWALITVFVVIFGGLGSAFLLASHADAFNCQSAVLDKNPVLRCIQPCPTGTHGNKASDSYYYCFGQATTALSNCQAVVVNNVPAHRCNFGCPVPTNGNIAGGYFYCFGTPASETPAPTPTPTPKPTPAPTPTPAPASSSATKVSCTSIYDGNSQRCAGSCPAGTTGKQNSTDKYYYCSVPITCQSTTYQGKPIQRCKGGCPSNTTGSLSADTYYYCKSASSTGGSPSTGSGGSTTSPSSVPAAYVGLNDGCGSDAGHYYVNGSVVRHINNSYTAINAYNKCKCTKNQQYISYVKNYTDQQPNPGCKTTSGGGSTSGGGNSSGANTPGAAGTSCDSVLQQTPAPGGNGYICHGSLYCPGGYTATDGVGAHGQSVYCKLNSPSAKTPAKPPVNGRTINGRGGKQV